MTIKYHETIVKDPVKIIESHWKSDARGKLIEVLRNDSDFYDKDFGQAYVTTIRPGIVKAWHYHKEQIDRMFLLKGRVRFGCVGYVKSCETTLLDLVVTDENPKLIIIPKGIFHGFGNVGNDEAYILNIPTKEYNRKKPDEYRKEPDFFNSKFDWTNIKYWG